MLLPLQFYNSKTKRKETFTPIIPGQIKLYACGMTVYDFCHIGHARLMACFDTLVRALRAMGYQVSYVRNITDIDDKIIKRAEENHETIGQLTQRYIDALHQDSEALMMLPPDHEPRATDYIPQMIDLIDKLMWRGLAYVTPQGDVCYDVSAFPAYGELSGQDLEKLRAGARVHTSEDKQDPLDFVLWKHSKAGEPSWPSPWGNGRPGWHIECSAMSCALLGEHFDIHGGGMDLLFPHHENEVAQSVGGYQCQFANTWLHCGFVQIDQEKMSKSLGNFFTIRDVLKECPAEVLRYFLVSAHYRSPLNYSQVALTQAAQNLDRFYFALRDLSLAEAVKPEQENFSQRFFAALADDLNTPEAFAVLFELAKEVNRLKLHDRNSAASLAKLLVELCSILGIGQQDPESYFQAQAGIDVAKIEALIAQRQQARQNKDWAKADHIRDQLNNLGIVLDDTAQGVKWRKQEIQL